jgi:hypothetical protein
MITEQDFLAFAEAKPEMIRTFYKAVNAVIEYRKEEAANQSGWWATARLKKKQLAVTFLMIHFPNSIIFDGQPISEEEKKLVRSWILSAANFHMLPKAEQDVALVHNAAQFEAAQAGLGDIEVVG